MQASEAPGPTTHRIANYAEPPRPLGGLATTAIVMLAIQAVLAAITFIVELAYIGAIDEYLRGTGSLTDVEDLEAGLAGIGGLNSIFFFVGAGFFIAWLYRAYANLRRTSVAGLRYDPGWAIGAWFVPVFWWIGPKQIVDDVWRAGERGAQVRDTTWRARPVSPLLHWWWALWVVSFLLGIAAFAAGFDADDFRVGAELGGIDYYERQQTSATIAAPASLCLIAAAILACVVLRRISERDDRLREAVFALPGPAAAMAPPPPPPPPASTGQPPPPTTPPLAVAPAPVGPTPAGSQPPPPSGPPLAELEGGLIPTGEGERLRCGRCGWVFSDAAAARRHLEAHHGREKTD